MWLMNPLREYIFFFFANGSTENGFLVSDRYLCPFSLFLVLGSCRYLALKNMDRNIYAFDFFIKIETWNREQNFVFVFIYFSKKKMYLCSSTFSKKFSSFSDFFQVTSSISSKPGSAHWMRLSRQYFPPSMECEFQKVKNPHSVEVTLLTKVLYVDNFIV